MKRLFILYSLFIGSNVMASQPPQLRIGDKIPKTPEEILKIDCSENCEDCSKAGLIIMVATTASEFTYGIITQESLFSTFVCKEAKPRVALVESLVVAGATLTSLVAGVVTRAFLHNRNMARKQEREKQYAEYLELLKKEN